MSSPFKFQLNQCHHLLNSNLTNVITFSIPTQSTNVITFSIPTQPMSAPFPFQLNQCQHLFNSNSTNVITFSIPTQPMSSPFQFQSQPILSPLPFQSQPMSTPFQFQLNQCIAFNASHSQLNQRHTVQYLLNPLISTQSMTSLKSALFPYGIPIKHSHSGSTNGIPLKPSHSRFNQWRHI